MDNPDYSEALAEFLEGEDGAFLEDREGAIAMGDGGIEAAALPEVPLPVRARRIPILPPWLVRASGLYEWSLRLLPRPLPIPVPVPTPGPLPVAPGAEAPEDEEGALIPILFLREELRLDIDGRYPQMTASGTLHRGIAMQVHWIARLRRTGVDTYVGYIWYKDGNTTYLPHTRVRIQVVRSVFTNGRKAMVTFQGGGAPNRVRTYRWKSAYYHPVEFEFDYVHGTQAITSMDTCAHPNRPSNLSCERLTIERVYERAGFDASVSRFSAEIPIDLAKADRKWSDAEMHDAMQRYWSRFANRPQWAMWVLFASLHERGTSLGGIMFDDIGPNHRQGTAIFNDSFIKNPPTGDPNPSAWVRRMRFWTAVHEMGHAFNLAHSWQKALGTPWIPLSNDSEARSFMNYPFRVSGGESTFFSDFTFRFIDEELLFLRHAPARFVQPGNADWFDHHGFQQANVSLEHGYDLEIRVHREQKYFEFMEPVTIELKLTNTSGKPKIVDESLLGPGDNLTVIIKKQDKPAREWLPYAHYCYGEKTRVLGPGQSIYRSLFIAAGRNGLDLAEPGNYTVQAALHLEDQDVVSKPLRLRVAPPRTYDEEFLAQDFFTEDVGRTLVFGGTQVLEEANNTLREVAAKLKDRRVTVHANVALAKPLAIQYKVLELEALEEVAAAADASKSIKVAKPKPDEAKKVLNEALVKRRDAAVETLGHIPYGQMIKDLGTLFDETGDPGSAATAVKECAKTFAKRGVLDSVVNEFEDAAKRYASRKTAKKSTRRTRTKGRKK